MYVLLKKELTKFLEYQRYTETDVLAAISSTDCNQLEEFALTSNKLGKSPNL